MCLYTKYVLNPKYKPNKKNGGNPPKCNDKRLLYIPAKCGKCIECRKQKQREWVIRLSEEIRNNKVGLYVTLTIDNKSFKELRENKNETENDIATKALRRFLERIRKETGKSVKHWAITELGEERGRMHLHGIFFCKQKLIEKHWKYGFVFIGNYVNEKTIFYITKYMLKRNENNPNFEGKVLCSSGIGANYINREDAKNNSYKENKTAEIYRLRNGTKLNLPQYYRIKLYTEEEREKLWIEKQEKGYRYIMGEKVYLDDVDAYNNILEFYQNRGKELYKDNPEEWDREAQQKRLQKMKLYREKELKRIYKK